MSYRYVFDVGPHTEMKSRADIYAQVLLGHVTSDNLYRKITSAIEQNQLPLEKLISAWK